MLNRPISLLNRKNFDHKEVLPTIINLANDQDIFFIIRLDDFQWIWAVDLARAECAVSAHS